MSPPGGLYRGWGGFTFIPLKIWIFLPLYLYNIGASIFGMEWHTEELKLLFDEHDSDDSTLL